MDKERPAGYRVKNANPRTLVTRFGDITFSRRLYQDRQGEYHFLLDEYLNWRPHQAATPSLTEALLDSATGNTFRKVSREVEKYTAGVLSASTVHGLLQRVTQDVIDKEREMIGIIIHFPALDIPLFLVYNIRWVHCYNLWPLS
jgi:hypothetical protein